MVKKIRVLDLGRVLAGPFAAQILGDLGAEVIKVEHPLLGDDTRSWKPPSVSNDSAYFFATNRNKKSIGIDFKSKEGLKILYDLIKNSDVLIENFRPGVTKRLKIDYKIIQKLNPKLIYCSISGFGQTGTLSNRAAYDYVVQAMSGILSLTGEINGDPVRCAGAISDYGTGVWAVVSILFALLQKNQTKKGQHIDLAMQDTTLCYLSHVFSMYLADQSPPKRIGNGHNKIVPTNVYQTKDKPLMILCGNESMFHRLCKAVGKPNMFKDPRFIDNRSRSQNVKLLDNILKKILRTDTRNNWIKKFSKYNVAVSPIRSVEEICKAKDIKERNMIIDFKHQSGKKISMLGTPLKFSKFKTCEKVLPPPQLNQHTKEILKNTLGYSDKKIKNLLDTRVVGRYEN